MPAAVHQLAPIPHIRIEPRSGWGLPNWQELWRHRELLWQLVRRDISVRYKQTLLGAAWAVMQPLFTMLVFTLFFGRLAGIADRDTVIPYSVSTYCALLAWQLFANALNGSSKSIVANRNLITKVYFPRLLIPLAPIFSGLVDFVIALAVLLIMMACHGIGPGWAILGLPLAVGLALLTSLAVGTWLAALNALYRDVEYTLPFLTQLWLFLTPVAYPTSLVPEPWRVLYGLNPMVGVVESFRWSLLGAPPAVELLLLGTLVTSVLLIAGLAYFQRVERVLVDVV